MIYLRLNFIEINIRRFGVNSKIIIMFQRLILLLLMILNMKKINLKLI